jgi:hypothetical protein
MTPTHPSRRWLLAGLIAGLFGLFMAKKATHAAPPVESAPSKKPIIDPDASCFVIGPTSSYSFQPGGGKLVFSTYLGGNDTATGWHPNP